MYNHVSRAHEILCLDAKISNPNLLSNSLLHHRVLKIFSFLRFNLTISNSTLGLQLENSKHFRYFPNNQVLYQRIQILPHQKFLECIPAKKHPRCINTKNIQLFSYNYQAYSCHKMRQSRLLKQGLTIISSDLIYIGGPQQWRISKSKDGNGSSMLRCLLPDLGMEPPSSFLFFLFFDS